MANTLQSNLFYAGGTASVSVPVVTEWADFTLISTGFSAATVDHARFRRVGENVEIVTRITSCSTNATLVFDLVSSLSITPKVNISPVGYLSVDATNTFWNAYTNGGGVEFYQSGAVLGNADLSSSIVMVSISVPITEWQTTALIGTTASATTTTEGMVKIPGSEFSVNQPLGHGSSGIRVRTWQGTPINVGAAITYTADTTDGDYCTINQDGIYTIAWSDERVGGSHGIYISRNAVGTVTGTALNTTQLLGWAEGDTAQNLSTTATARLSAGDVIRCHDDGGGSSTNTQHAWRITQIVVL